MGAWRKLIYGVGLVAGGCALGLPHGADGGAMAAAVMGAVAGLMGGVGGNVAHELLNEADEKWLGGISSQALDIDENHHVLLQLRRSHLKALGRLAADFEPEAVSASDKAFLEGLTNFLKAADTPDRLLPQAEVTPEEKAVFKSLPQVLQAGLQARQTDAGKRSKHPTAMAMAGFYRAAFSEMAAEIGLDCPNSFLSLVSRENGGFIDLFVRDAAGALKDNEAFRRIWTAEQQQQILAAVQDMRHELRDGFGEIHTRLDKVLAAVAQKTGVDPEKLKPILIKLGQTEIPVSQYAEALSAAVDDLLAQSRERVLPSNMGPEIDVAIIKAREKLAALDTDGARGVLRDAIAVQRQKRQAEARAEGQLLLEMARIEEAGFGYDAAISHLKAVTLLDPERLEAWRHLGEICWKVGKLSDSKLAFEALLAHSQKAGDDRYEMFALDEIGDVLCQQGDFRAALENYMRVLSIAERRGVDKNSANAQHNLNVGLIKVGNIFRHLGNYVEAIKYYHFALEVAEGLAEKQSHAQSQRDLSISLSKIGDVSREQGNLDVAVEYFGRVLIISEKLAEDKSDSQAQRDLSLSLERIGDMFWEAGDLDAALERYMRVLTICELLAKDENDIRAQRDLSRSLNKIGDVFLKEEKWNAALEQYRRALDIREKLVTDEHDVQIQRDIGISLAKIGDALRNLGDTTGALECYNRGLAVVEQLAINQTDVYLQKDIFNLRWQLACIYDDLVSWAKVVECMEVAQERGILLPADLRFLRRARAQVARLGGSI